MPYHMYEDLQSRPVRAVCSLCGRDLIEGESCWRINGAVICTDCLPTWARRDYAGHHCVCGEEDAP